MNERERDSLLNNFIPISRGLFDHYLWEEDREFSKFEAWLYLLKEARYKDARIIDNNVIIEVSRGQLYVSQSFLTGVFGWTPKRVRTFLSLLESDGMISREQHATTRQTIITILNYGVYNPDINEKAPEKTEEKILPANPEKTVRFNFKKALEDIGVNSDLASEWLLVRRQKKATNTLTAFNKIKNEIEKSGMSANECVKIAVERSWRGFAADWVKDKRKTVHPFVDRRVENYEKF